MKEADGNHVPTPAMMAENVVPPKSIEYEVEQLGDGVVQARFYHNDRSLNQILYLQPDDADALADRLVTVAESIRD